MLINIFSCEVLPHKPTPSIATKPEIRTVCSEAPRLSNNIILNIYKLTR